MNKPISLDAWDRDIVPVLNQISWHARRSAQFADLVNIDVQKLATQPAFRSQTEHDLEQAIMSLKAALANYRDKAKDAA